MEAMVVVEGDDEQQGEVAWLLGSSGSTDEHDPPQSNQLRSILQLAFVTANIWRNF
jgi:hypothetical protein